VENSLWKRLWTCRGMMISHFCIIKWGAFVTICLWQPYPWEERNRRQGLERCSMITKMACHYTHNPYGVGANPVDWIHGTPRWAGCRTDRWVPNAMQHNLTAVLWQLRLMFG
jgi:hypothetical protein